MNDITTLASKLLPFTLLVTVACSEHVRAPASAATSSEPPAASTAVASSAPVARQSTPAPQSAPAPTPQPIAPGSADCGTIVDTLNAPGSNELSASNCFLAAFTACLPAKLSHVRRTDEGGTVVQSMNVVKTGSTCEVTLLNDTSRDPFGGGTTSERCTGMKLTPTVSGATLGFDGCR